MTTATPDRKGQDACRTSAISDNQTFNVFSDNRGAFTTITATATNGFTRTESRDRTTWQIIRDVTRNATAPTTTAD